MSGRNDKIKGFFVATCFKKFTAWSDANNNNNNQTAQAMQCPASITNVDQIPTHLRYLLYLAHQAFPQILTSNYIEGVPETAGTKKQIAEFEKQQQLQQEKEKQQQKNDQESENVPPTSSSNTESASTSIIMIPPKKKTVKACLGTFVRECVSKMHGSSLVILTRNHLKLLAIICGLAENPFASANEETEQQQQDSSSILSTFETAFKAMKVPQVMAFDSYYDEVNPPKTREEERLEREAIQAEIDRREWEAFEEAARLAKERQQARADAKAEKQRLEQEQKRQELELKRQEKEKKKAEKAAAKLLRQQQREAQQAALLRQQQQQQQSLPLRRNRFTNNDDDGDDEEGYYNNDDEDNEDSNQFWAGGGAGANNNNARRNNKNNNRVRASLNNPNLQLMNNNNIPTSSSSSSSSSDNDDDQKQQQQQDELTVVDNNPHFRIAQRHNNGHAGIQKNSNNTQQQNSNQNNSNDNNNEDSNLNAPTFSMALLENKIFQIICAVQTIALRDLPKEIRKTERTSNIGTGWTEADVWTCVQRLRNTGAIMFDEDVIYKL